MKEEECGGVHTDQEKGMGEPPQVENALQSQSSAGLLTKPKEELEIHAGGDKRKKRRTSG